MRTALERALGEVEDLVPLRGALTGEQVQLVVAVEMHLGICDRRVAFPRWSSLDDVGVAGGGDKCGEPVEPGEDAVLNLAGWHLARPASDARHAKAAFERRPLASGKGSLAAVWPGEVLGAVVGAENTRIVSSARPLSSRYFITEPTMSSSCAMPAS